MGAAVFAPSLPAFDVARARIEELRGIFRDSPTGAARGALEHVRELCHAARGAIDDDHCRRRIELLEEHAWLLFGGDEPWARGESLGPQALRLQGLKLLSSFERWLSRAETAHGLSRTL
jgi:hypothetical protein